MPDVVVYTDHTFDDLQIEREVLEGLDVRIVDGETESNVRRHFTDAAALAVMFDDLTAADVEALDACRIVTRIGTGVDNFDVASLSERNIPLANVPEYCTTEVSEHALALLLGLERTILEYDSAVRSGDWTVETGRTPTRLAGQTLGVVSFGQIGRAVARKADALGMDVVVFSFRTAPSDVRAAGHEPAATLPALLDVADAVTVHAPLTPQTAGLFDEAAFEAMADGALFVNTARGGIVEHHALVSALENGAIAGAALDVFPDEPLPPDDPLLDRQDVLLTPHVAWYSAESERDLRRQAASNVRAVLEGGWPDSVVNADHLD